MRLASVFIEDLINTILTFALALRPDGNTIAFILILKNVLQPIAGALSRPLFVEMSPKCTTTPHHSTASRSRATMYTLK